jgi:hypothetical protein
MKYNITKEYIQLIMQYCHPNWKILADEIEIEHQKNGTDEQGDD